MRWHRPLRVRLKSKLPGFNPGCRAGCQYPASFFFITKEKKVASRMNTYIGQSQVWIEPEEILSIGITCEHCHSRTSISLYHRQWAMPTYCRICNQAWVSTDTEHYGQQWNAVKNFFDALKQLDRARKAEETWLNLGLEIRHSRSGVNMAE